MGTSPTCRGRDDDRQRPPTPQPRRRSAPVSEIAAVWMLPLLGVAVLALVWLV